MTLVTLSESKTSFVDSLFYFLLSFTEVETFFMDDIDITLYFMIAKMQFKIQIAIFFRIFTSGFDISRHFFVYIFDI